MDTSFSNKTVVVTGARSGVGLELTKELLRRGARVFALMRSPFAEDAALPDGPVTHVPVDLASSSSLCEAAESVRRQAPRVDVLFNNAGVSPAQLERSPQGRELGFEVNTLAPHALTQALRPSLSAARGVVVNVSSNALLNVRRFDPAELAAPAEYRKLFGPYASSKLALSLWTRASAASFAADGIRLVSVWPGGNRTPMTAGDGMPFWLRPFARFFFSHPSVGARRVLDAATRDDVESGSFLLEGRVRALPFAAQGPDVLRLVEELTRPVAN